MSVAQEIEVTDEQVVDAGIEKLNTLSEQIAVAKTTLDQLEIEKETTETFLTNMVKQKNPNPIVFKGKRFHQWVLSTGKVLTVNNKTRHSTKYSEALKRVKSMFATQPEVIREIDTIIREETNEKQTDELKIEKT